MMNPYTTGNLAMNQMSSYYMNNNLNASSYMMGQQVTRQRMQQSLQASPQTQRQGRATYLGVLGQDYMDNGILDGSSLAAWAQQTGAMQPDAAAYSMQFEMQLDRSDDGQLNGSHLVQGMNFGVFGSPLNQGYIA